MLTRVTAIADPSGAADPAYAVGLRGAVTDAIEYGLAALGGAGDSPSPVPVSLLAQARLAARNGIGLDVVLRRYVAGYSLLDDFVLEEAAGARLPADSLKSLLAAQALLLDRLTAAVGEEYEREASAPHGTGRRRHALVRRLLAGEPLDPTALGYRFEGHHLALVASGQNAAPALAGIAERLDRRLLLTEPDAQLAWAWLGGERHFADEELDLLSSGAWPKGCAIGCGEPGHGLSGWRLTHRQAQAALPIGLQAGQTLVRYGEVALLAAVCHDDLLATSLSRMFLEPLEENRDGGIAARATLRAYLSTGCNVSSAAAVLGINRHTAAARIKAIERRLGCPLGTCLGELQVALGLEELQGR